jgi:hypothetical protein
MWAILIAILLCTQNYINKENRPENAKSKFHAQNQSVYPTEKINRPTNWAETLGNSKSTIATNELNFTAHFSDHNSQEANAEILKWSQKPLLATKFGKNCTRKLSDNELTSQFFTQGQLLRNPHEITYLLNYHSCSTFCRKTTPSVFSFLENLKKWTKNTISLKKAQRRRKAGEPRQAIPKLFDPTLHSAKTHWNYFTNADMLAELQSTKREIQQAKMTRTTPEVKLCTKYQKCNC